MGTGTSQGVPLIACDCPVCASLDPRDVRYRTHVHVEMGGLNLQVDAAPEFRLRALELGLRKIDAVFLTHGHADHILGFDDMRRFCDLRGAEALPVYGEEFGLERLRAIFPYAILDKPKVRGYPAFIPKLMPESLSLGDAGMVRSALLPHGRFQTLGLVFEERATGSKLAYYTDCKGLGKDAVDLARGADLLVIDGLRERAHPSHMNFEEAVAAARQVGAARTLLIHMAHEWSHAKLEDWLPEGMAPAHDGLVLEL